VVDNLNVGLRDNANVDSPSPYPVPRGSHSIRRRIKGASKCDAQQQQWLEFWPLVSREHWR